jgi:integral membrane protein
VMLLLVVVEMIAKYGFGSDIIAGGTSAATGETVALGFNNVAEQTITGGFNLSTAVLIVHGWMYVVYLIADFRLWSLMRWPFSKFILIALGGVIPFLSFIVETRILYSD